MKTSKMIMGFAFVGLLLLCSAVFAQTTTPPAGAEVDKVESRGYVVPSSTINDGVGVLISPNVTEIKEYPDIPGAPKQTLTTPATRQVPLPSYATANVETVALPGGGELRIKAPSDQDAAPAFINTGNVDQDKLNHIKALNEYFGYDEIEDEAE